MTAFSLDHLYAVGPRWSDRRSRGRSARPGVRGAAAPGAAAPGAAAPGAAVREIVG